MIKLKYLLFVFIGTLFFIPNVFAQNINLSPATFSVNGTDFYSGMQLFQFSPNQSTTTATTVGLNFVQSSSEDRMSYFIMDVCSTLPFTVERSNKGSCDQYGCMINPKVYDLKTSCKVGSYNGSSYRVYFDIAQWEMGSGNVSLWRIDTNAKFFPKYSANYNAFGNLITAYLSNTDNGESLQNAELISGSINSVNSSIGETNDKLDETNDKLDETNDKLNETNKELGDLNDNITDANTDNPSGKFNEFESYLPENGVITQLITLPISLFQKVLNSINGTCSEYSLGNLLGTNLTFPCINISNYIGSTIWNVIDILFSGFFVLKISKKMIKTFNSFSSMEEGDVLD